MYVQRNIEARSRNHYYLGKAINVTYFKFVSVTLVFRRAKRMRLIILSSVDSPAIPCSSTLSDKRHDFRNKVI